jgi:hypothetical protein
VFVPRETARLASIVSEVDMDPEGRIDLSEAEKH